MADRPIVPLEPATESYCGLDRLVDMLVTLLLGDADEGRRRVQALLCELYGLDLVHIGAPGTLPVEWVSRPYMALRAPNGVILCAWPPERLVDPAVRSALHVVARYAHRIPAGEPVEGTAALAGGRLLGRSAAMRQLHERIARVARRTFSVLIEGESGVGKELVARQVHALSARRQGPFVAVNCAAIVESLLEAELFGIEERTATGVRGRRGKFEVADGGTLFLDEVSDLSAGAQAKLLRAIQDLTVERVGGHGSRHVDVRIVAATNRSLAGAVARGTFRQDLYYRLNAVEVCVPPLRARHEDIPLLAEAFLERYRDGRAYRLAAPAMDALLVHDWPGNVRELERALERAVTLAPSDVIQVDDLPDSVTGKYRQAMAVPVGEADDSMRAWGSRYARLVLERAGGNKREACRVLDISYHTLKAYLEYRGPRAASTARTAMRLGNTGERPGPTPVRYPSSPGLGTSAVHDAPAGEPTGRTR